MENILQCNHRELNELSGIRIHGKRELFLQVFVVDNIPLLVNGKTDRQALLQRYEEQNTGNDGKQTTHTAFQAFILIFIFTYKSEYLFVTLPLNSLFTEGLEKTSEESLMAHIIDYPTFYLETEGIHDKSVSHNKCLQWYSHLSYADVLSTKSNRTRNKQNL